MAKRHKTRSNSIGVIWQIAIAAIVAIFIVSGGASIANSYLGFINLSGWPAGTRSDQTGLILGVLACAIGLGVLIWRRITGGISHQWAATVLGIRSLADIYAMTPSQFEAFVGFLFKARGYDAQLVGQTGDQGIDIELRRRGVAGSPRVVAQCKRYQGSVGQPIVREFYGSFAERAAEGYLVTTGTFTQPAREWAASRPLHLVDGNALLDWTDQVARDLREHHQPAPQFLAR